MQVFSGNWRGVAAAAALGVAAICWSGSPAHAQAGGAAPAAAAKEKAPKDAGEYEIANETIKDLNPQAPNYAKAVTDLQTWTQKYPDSDYKDDRLFYLMQAYDGLSQSDKVLDAAAPLLSRDLKAVFKERAEIFRVLYLTVRNTSAITDDSSKATEPEQLANGEKAADQLKSYEVEFFADANKPANATAEAWKQARDQVDAIVQQAFLSLALYPGNAAMKQYKANRDASSCATAEESFTKTVEKYPDSALAAYALGSSLLCQQKTAPAKVSAGIYEIARAAAIDPVKGWIDPKYQSSSIGAYLTSVYNQYHGADEEGLKQLKEQALKAPLAPTGFHIESTTEKAVRLEEEFRAKNPQLALWMSVKAKLADADGEKYFEDSLKNAAVSKLKGTLIEARPACKPTELVVGVADSSHPEVTLKLDTALAGKPDTGGEIQWQGVPSAFTKEPFMLTMDTEKAQVEGLNLSACTAAAVRPPAKKGAAPKK